MTGFLHDAAMSSAAQDLFDEDQADVGYVMNVSRLWAYEPLALSGLFNLMDTVSGSFSVRTRGILATACASALGDAYCALVWGGKLADAASAHLAAGVLSGDDEALTAAETTMAAWARKVTRDPNSTTADDVHALRAAGFDDDAIFGMTVYIGLRIALGTVNDALGVGPDAQLAVTLPAAIREAVTFGRPIESPGPTAPAGPDL